MIEFDEYIKKNNLGECYYDKSFKDITTIKIGGKIKLLFYPSSNENMINFYRFYLKNKTVPLIIIGNGSNIFANSKTYDGIVVSLKKIKQDVIIEGTKVIVNSGMLITNFINKLKEKNIGGLEKLAYIPGTIGGMIKMNASAYNCNITDYLNYITCIDEKGELVIYNKKELNFNYRSSSIKDCNIILNCCFELEYKEKNEINNVIDNIQKDRYLKQPLEYYNAGSTFKNASCSAWKLIDKVGLRGYQINDAMISNKHCNFLINKGNCKSEDMLALINLIKRKVSEELGFTLECEWVYINF